jgi:hypothetical protein
MGIYDARSDDKSVEPESVVVTKMGDKTILFVGFRRADAVMVYDVSNPAAPKFFTDFKTDAPEGLLLFQLRKSYQSLMWCEQ